MLKHIHRIIVALLIFLVAYLGIQGTLKYLAEDCDTVIVMHQVQGYEAFNVVDATEMVRGKTCLTFNRESSRATSGQGGMSKTVVYVQPWDREAWVYTESNTTVIGGDRLGTPVVIVWPDEPGTLCESPKPTLVPLHPHNPNSGKTRLRVEVSCRQAV